MVSGRDAAVEARRVLQLHGSNTFVTGPFFCKVPA